MRRQGLGSVSGGVPPGSGSATSSPPAVQQTSSSLPRRGSLRPPLVPKLAGAASGRGGDRALDADERGAPRAQQDRGGLSEARSMLKQQI